MNQKTHSKPFQGLSSFETKASKQSATILPSITMRSSQFWPVMPEYKPYAGPTLWRPQNSKQKKLRPFLTLTPTKTSSKNTISFVSLTPRQKTFESIETESEVPVVHCHGSESFSKLTPLPSIQHKNDNHNDANIEGHHDDDRNHRTNRLNNSSIIPDVYSLTGSKQRSKGASNSNSVLDLRHDRKFKNTHIKSSKSQWSFGLNSTLLNERNSQDNGTIFSKRYRMTYSKIARDPTFLPVRKEEVVRNKLNHDVTHDEVKQNAVESEDNTVFRQSQNKGGNFGSRLSKQQRKSRRNYIRIHAHGQDSDSEIIRRSQNLRYVTQQATSTCDSHNLFTSNVPCAKDINSVGTKHNSSAVNDAPVISSDYDNENHRISRDLRNHCIILDGKDRVNQRGGLNCAIHDNEVSRTNDLRRNDTDYCSKHRNRVVSSQFCDVLGQKTCRRCQEFYDKNFLQPPKEKTERIRSPGLVTISRENSIVVPTVGLQRVVIRVRDDQGEMAVAAIGVNPGLM